MPGPGREVGKKDTVVHAEAVGSYTAGGHNIIVEDVSSIEDAEAVLVDQAVQGGGIVTTVEIDSISENTVTIIARELDAQAATPAWAEVADATNIGTVKIVAEGF